MNFFKENKFLAGILGVMLLAALALGFLLLQATGRFSEATAIYDSQAQELARLQGLSPFPNESNLKKMQAQRKEHQGVVDALQQQLAATEVPLVEITPEAFQDKLRAAVTDTVKRAEAAGVKLPGEGKFFMGFDQYEGAPPRTEAAAPLARQLGVVQLIMDTLITNKVAELREFKRPELPEESGTAPAQAEERGGRRAQGEKKGTDLLKAIPINLVFLVDQSLFRNILNSLITSKTQFLIPRVVTVRNENPKPPPRVIPGMNPAVFSPTPPTGDPNAPALPGVPAAAPAAPAQVLKYIVGEERVEVTMQLEQVDFADPAPAK